jgi:hypothetical protein
MPFAIEGPAAGPFNDTTRIPDGNWGFTIGSPPQRPLDAPIAQEGFTSGDPRPDIIVSRGTLPPGHESGELIESSGESTPVLVIKDPAGGRRIWYSFGRDDGEPKEFVLYDAVGVETFRATTRPSSLTGRRGL